MPLAVLAALTNFAEESVMKGARARAERQEGSSQVEGTEDVKAGMLKQSNRIYRADTMFTRVLEEASFT